MNKKTNEPTTSETRALSTVPPSELQDLIRRRAYELYEQRGGRDGRELDDWLQAQAEVAQSIMKAAA